MNLKPRSPATFLPMELFPDPAMPTRSIPCMI
jgi:hypothetical protein